MIMRRREANRLAAHRLRVRKKGYQDSLEERIRQLEEERATLLHRLELVEPRASHGQHGPWAKKQGLAPGGGLSWSNPSLNTGYRSSGNTDTDLRVASLEAANRRLQDELKNVNEENERLQAKLLDQRTQWERSLPASSPRPNSSRFSEPQVSFSPLVQVLTLLSRLHTSHPHHAHCLTFLPPFQLNLQPPRCRPYQSSPLPCSRRIHPGCHLATPTRLLIYGPLNPSAREVSHPWTRYRLNHPVFSSRHSGFHRLLVRQGAQSRPTGLQTQLGTTLHLTLICQVGSQCRRVRQPRADAHTRLGHIILRTRVGNSPTCTAHDCIYSWFSCMHWTRSRCRRHCSRAE